tara:strand:+ start:229 stop:558 length:330 start_codon:yes stop_codon:yes gene_type:complete
MAKGGQITMNFYEIFREAVLSARPIRCHYHGYERLVCPHVIGRKNGAEQVLTYQYGGGSRSGLPPTGEWRCMRIAEATSAEVISGDWRTDHRHSRPQTCVDQIDVEVEF